ncbi:hypothetical protein C8J55DRAFT_494296 [Lentinula edodes]|uniref:Uncharacterized protein n=1 Tax=Lentinula lateritia TaxID=40482 RepID=A0A9W8ZQP1_9AGAR|nr:hypothetical protein C8J55DRAFT_494296 [Lentinula edodes]
MWKQCFGRRRILGWDQHTQEPQEALKKRICYCDLFPTESLKTIPATQDKKNIRTRKVSSGYHFNSTLLGPVLLKALLVSVFSVEDVLVIIVVRSGDVDDADRDSVLASSRWDHRSEGVGRQWKKRYSMRLETLILSSKRTVKPSYPHLVYQNVTTLNTDTW